MFSGTVSAGLTMGVVIARSVATVEMSKEGVVPFAELPRISPVSEREEHALTGNCADSRMGVVETLGCETFETIAEMVLPELL